ncbi:MAG: hypothetical protein ACXAEF_12450, partial [Candidatus Thorarchaeota archaeon]
IASGIWNSSAEVITIGLSGLGLGSYNYTLVVYDVDLNSANDTVYVSVVDGTPPIINTPSDIVFTEGETGYSIDWAASDLHPTTYSIFQNEVEVQSGNWDVDANISISLDGLPAGSYNYTIVVYDIGGNSVSDQVDVTVNEAETTTTTTTSTTTTTTSTTTTTTTTSQTETSTTTQDDDPFLTESLITIVASWVGSLIVVLVIAEIIIRRRNR